MPDRKKYKIPDLFPRGSLPPLSAVDEAELHEQVTDFVVELLASCGECIGALTCVRDVAKQTRQDFYAIYKKFEMGARRSVYSPAMYTPPTSSLRAYPNPPLSTFDVWPELLQAIEMRRYHREKMQKRKENALSV